MVARVGLARRSALWTVVLALGVVAGPRGAWAHALTPSLLELQERPNGRVGVLWRTPEPEGSQAPLSPRLPPSCTPVGEVRRSSDGLGDSARFEVACANGRLAGLALGVEGLEARREAEVLVRIELADGQSIVRVLRPTSATLTIPAERTRLVTVREYVALGVHHILTGYDHLMFVLGLLLLVPTRRALVGAISAFTVAHSITLTLATCGLVHFPTRAGEAVIALSIVFLAYELTRPRAVDAPVPLSRRRPWVVAFTFGLIHGFGFAGALAEVGLPSRDVPLALLGFNVGVELGQLGCVAAALVAGALVRRLAPAITARGVRLLAYAMGSFATAWFIERLVLLASSPV